MKLLAFEKSVGTVVYRKEGEDIRYLLLCNNYWGFPKGHPEHGESEEETLRRETEEESGIGDLEIASGFKSKNGYSYLSKGRERADRIESGRGIFIIKRVVFYLAETKTENIVISHEHNASGWFSYTDAMDHLAYENIRKTLKDAHEFLQKTGNELSYRCNQ
ncbi:MAG: NUDIX domain-containing protein [Candidatus Moranbacteria bacterium]|nr:NUDIX domain-containing protein [Candidatus Moranbacteria bacterium]